MPPKARRETTAKAAAPAAGTSKRVSIAPQSPSAAAAARAKSAAAEERAARAEARARAASQSSEDSDRSAADHNIVLCGFPAAEVEKYDIQMVDPWTVQTNLTDSMTHLVIKSMVGLEKSQQYLPIYYAVLKGLWVLRPSFLPVPAGTSRRKSLRVMKPLQDEKEHAYNGREIDSNAKAKSNFPNIHEVTVLQKTVKQLKEEGKTFLGAPPFQKVVIFAGRTKESKQRKEELKMVMEAGGATVVDDTVFKTWKAKRNKGGDIETPSMAVIVKMNASVVGLDDEAIRDLLKARAPIFYEEFITDLLMNSNCVVDLDHLLLQSFVSIRDHMHSVDPDGKLQKLVMNEDDDDEDEMTSRGSTPPSDRRDPKEKKMEVKKEEEEEKAEAWKEVKKEVKKEEEE